MVSSQEGRMCKICTWIIAEDNVLITPTGLARHVSRSPDGASNQGFPPGGYKCLLFFIIGCLINKSRVDSAWALVVDRFSIKRLEHRVTGVQWFPVTVLKPQRATSNMSMQLTPNSWHSHMYQRCLTPRPPQSQDSRLHFRQAFHHWHGAAPSQIYLQVRVHHGDDVPVGVSGIVNPLWNTENFHGAGWELNPYRTRQD